MTSRRLRLQIDNKENDELITRCVRGSTRVYCVVISSNFTISKTINDCCHIN